MGSLFGKHISSVSIPYSNDSTHSQLECIPWDTNIDTNCENSTELNDLMKNLNLKALQIWTEYGIDKAIDFMNNDIKDLNNSF